METNTRVRWHEWKKMNGGGYCIKSGQLTIPILGAEHWLNSLENYPEVGRGYRVKEWHIGTPINPNQQSVLHAT